MKTKSNVSILYALLAAALYAISSPVSKLLLAKIPVTMMAALLYLGAGIGMLVIFLFRNRQLSYQKGNAGTEMKLTKKELPFTLGMVILDIAAPIFLMLGLSLTAPSTVSLLNNFEIAATSLIAFFIFKEAISKRVWIGICLITVSTILLSVKDFGSLSFSFGSLFVLLACICWGFENNCTRKLSIRDPLQIVIIKGFGSGLGSLLISLLMNEITTNVAYILATLILGFISYGLSIYFYVYAQRELGAARTSAYYAASPFIGVTISFVIFLELPTISFIIALLIMLLGTYITSSSGRTS